MKKLDLRIIFTLLIDIGLIYYSFFFASLLLNDFQISFDFKILIYSLLWIYPLYLLIFKVFNIYRYIWKYASMFELFITFLSVFMCFLGFSIITVIFNLPFQTNFIILSHIILFTLIGGFRYGNRVISQYFNQGTRNQKRTLIIGAGSCGVSVVKEIKDNSNLNNNIIAYVDDDIDKIGNVIQGIRVVGSTNELPEIIIKFNIEEVLICIPSLKKESYEKLLKKCENLHVSVKHFPSFSLLVEEDNKTKQIREVNITDLLGRDELVSYSEEIKYFIKDKGILVTGGGGTVGRALCHQIIEFKPNNLIILDQSENNAYDIQNELLMKIKSLNIDTKITILIGSVQDETRLYEVFSKYPIDLVFHTAAYKNIPLMEVSPKEAIKNNVFGTYHLAKLAHEFKVDKFMLISGNKANPQNIVGATLRLAEMIINAFSTISLTKYSAVRFGNVLESYSSIISLFNKQIKAGGQLTISDSKDDLYLMTIKEAIALVLEAGRMMRGYEIFVLDMGKSVNNIELVEKLTKLSGYEPYKDIVLEINEHQSKVKYKTEELLNDKQLEKTNHDKILYLRQKYLDIDKIKDYIEELQYLITVSDENIDNVLIKMIPTYKKQSMKEGIV